MEILGEGQGELLAWIDPEEHRHRIRMNKGFKYE